MSGSKRRTILVRSSNLIELSAANVAQASSPLIAVVQQPCCLTTQLCLVSSLQSPQVVSTLDPTPLPTLHLKRAPHSARTGGLQQLCHQHPIKSFAPVWTKL